MPCRSKSRTTRVRMAVTTSATSMEVRWGSNTKRGARAVGLFDEDASRATTWRWGLTRKSERFADDEQVGGGRFVTTPMSSVRETAS